MANCEFSEFSYGYALTSSLVRALKSVLKKAPVFPSLFDEGSAGGGYDLKLPLVPIPIFLQFKIPMVLTRSSTLKPAAYPVPYYRFPFRTKAPNQHNLLLKLEASSPLVFYVAPLFHKVAHLDKYFLGSNVHSHSTFVPPSSVGLLDSSAHHINYAPHAPTYWVRSEPRPIQGKSFEDMLLGLGARREIVRTELQLKSRVVSAGEADERRRAVFGGLIEWFGEQGIGFPSEVKRAPDIFVTEGRPIDELARRAGYLSQVQFGLAMGVIEAADSQPNTMAQ